MHYRRYVFYGACCLALLSSPIVPTVSYSASAATQTTQISEAEVKALLARMQTAAKANNATQLMSFFTPDAKIVAELPADMGGTMTFDTQAYKSMLQKGWSVLKDKQYTYEIKNVQIKVYPDKDRAFVTDETHESFKAGQKTITAVTQQQILVVRHQGQLKVKVLKGKAIPTS